MRSYETKTSFAGGELSPSLYARVDMVQYGIGARELTNFIVLPQGAIINRLGTEIIGNQRYKEVRLVLFVYSEEDSSVLLFSDEYIDVYKNGEVVERILGTPYDKDKIKEIRWLQSADVLYIFHPEVPV